MARGATSPKKSQSDREHFAGRRRTPRRRFVQPVECSGSSGKYAARTLELSRGGALVELRDPEFLGSAAVSSLLAFSQRVMEEYSGGMRIHFSVPALSLAARVVRTLRHPTSESLLVACEFLTELTDEQCRMLGLPTVQMPDA